MESAALPPLSRLPAAAAARLGAARADGRREARLEVLQVASGVALVGFMWTHVVLVSSVLLGAPVMDRLAAFLEDTRLAYWGAPPVVLLFLLHSALAARKIPSQARAWAAAASTATSLRHRDTAGWLVQVVTGMTVLLLGSIHLWVVLTDFPISAAKSGARVHGPALWLYLPLLLAVEAHASLGLYRAAMKWGWAPRDAARRLGGLLTLWFLALGAATLAALWRLGAGH